MRLSRRKALGEKSFERLQASIEKSRHCTLAKFIAGLGIPMVGRHAGRDLDRHFHGSWEAFEQAIQDGSTLRSYRISARRCTITFTHGMRIRREEKLVAAA